MGGITLSKRKNGNLETISSGSSSSDIEYYKILDKTFGILFPIVKAYISSGVATVVVIAPPYNLMEINTYSAGMWDKNLVNFYDVNNQTGFGLPEDFKGYFIKVMMLNTGKNEEEALSIFNSSFTPITKEEFYDLNNI